MKKLLLIFTLANVVIAGRCQTTELLSFEQHRIKAVKKGMLVLSGWSVANIIGGSVGTGTANKEVRYFHQMNVIWNSANFLIAGLGYWGASKENINDLTLSKVLLHQNKTEKTFLFNAALDATYITAGLYLTERSRRNTDPSKLKGYGNSVMFQGGFLLLFDVIMYNLHRQHGKKLTGFADKIIVVGSPAGISLGYQL
ncbi:MAG: hypothetical protein ABIN01_20070 [Ferruginibacter sp.]